MYIEPNTNIKLLRGVPLNPTYQHTIYFPNLFEQTSYFSSKTKHDLTRQSYQRVNSGVTRIQKTADECYDCNYMMFQNSNYGSKWFYAFITKINYISDVVTEITYEIDVLQTWLKDYQMKQCFVEREHSIIDDIGYNIVAEPIDIGEYMVSNYKEVDITSNDMRVIIAIVDVDESSSGELYDGIYGGAELWVYISTDVQAINNKVASYIQAPDSIIAMYMCPAFLIPNVPMGGRKLNFGTSGVINTVSFESVNDTMTFDGYKPKNKKLYTYPFNFFNVDNASGSSLPLRYEFFDGNTPVIEITGTITQPVKVVARPCSYKGVPSYTSLGGYTTYNPESITLESYPMCSWNTDTYKAWSAQNSVPIVLNTASSLAGSAVTSQYSAHPSGTMGMGAVSMVSEILSQRYKASISADVCRGTINNGGVNTATHRQKFYSSRVHVTRQYAQIIDNYFSMYGYAVNRVKPPNILSRPYWNYIKTNGAIITGNVPSDDISKICKIHDSGITYWKSAEYIGNYDLDNSP